MTAEAAAQASQAVELATARAERVGVNADLERLATQRAELGERSSAVVRVRATLAAEEDVHQAQSVALVEQRWALELIEADAAAQLARIAATESTLARVQREADETRAGSRV